MDNQKRAEYNLAKTRFKKMREFEKRAGFERYNVHRLCDTYRNLFVEDRNRYLRRMSVKDFNAFGLKHSTES